MELSKFLFHYSTRASNRSIYPIFDERFDHLETLLAICRIKNVLSAGSLCRPLVASPQSKCPKMAFMLPPKVSCFSLKYTIKATEMFHGKRKLTLILGAKPGLDPLQSAGSRALFYLISIMRQISTKDSGIL